MKHFYSKLLLALVGVLMPMVLHAYQVTVKVDNPEAVTVSLKWMDNSYNSLERNYEKASEYVVEFDDSQKYPMLYVSKVEGYKVVSVKDEEHNSEMYVYNGSVSQSLNAANDGYVYEVTTVNLAESRTATASVRVVGSADIIGLVRGDESVTLTADGTTEVKFIPEVENVFTIRNTSYSGAFYRLLLNNEPYRMDANSVEMTVADGDVIEIEANYPEIPVELTISVPEGLEDIVSSVSANYNPVEGWKVNEAFEVNAGSNINVNLNVNNYALDGVTLNGEPMEPSSYISFKIGTEPTTLAVAAHPYGTFDYTVNIDDPARVVIYKNYSEPIEGLVAGENALSISENNPSIRITATTGNDIVSITDKDGNAVEASYGNITITDGMYINVVSQPRVYDGKFVVFINDVENVVTNEYTGVYMAYWQCESDRSNYNYMRDNYTVIPFATVANEQYMITVQAANSYIAYENGELINNGYNSAYFSKYIVPENGTVYKIYTDGNAPEEHSITFEADDNAKNTKVTVDKITSVSDWANGVTVLTGTAVDIEAADDESLVVTVDGEALTADENGKFSFIAKANHVVKLTSATGVESVGVDVEAVNGAVYNLQGVKVLDNSADMNQLPAGIYVSNGKKHVVR